MTPAHERLDAVRNAGAKVDDRLIVEQQLEFIDCGSEGGDQRRSSWWVGALVWGVNAVAAVGALRHVHGKVGVPRERRGVFPVLWIDRNSDTGPDLHGVFSELKLRFEGLQEFFRDEERARRVRGTPRQDGKFIATQAADGVRLAENSAQPPS